MNVLLAVEKTSELQLYGIELWCFYPYAATPPCSAVPDFPQGR